MSNKEMCIVIGIVAVASFSALMLWGRKHARMISAARAVISRDKRQGSACNYVTEDRCFRKRRSGYLLYLLFFLVLVFVDFQDASGPHHGKKMYSNFNLMLEGGLFVLPLLLAVHQWIYRIFLSADYMRIRSFRTQTLRFDEMSNLRLTTFKASVYCVIEMKNGETVEVGSGLADFLGFVKLLSQKIHADG